MNTQDSRYSKYIAREAVRRLGEYYSWPSDHYTGSDVLFYLIGKPYNQDLVYTKALPEIAAVSYSLSEQVYPLFDYAQFIPTKFVRGSYMVTGTMAIYYTKRDWLFQEIESLYFPERTVPIQTQDFNYLSDEEKLALLDELITISIDIENSGNTEMHTRIVNTIRDIKQSVWSAGNQYLNNISTKPREFNYKPKFIEPEFNLLITHGPLGISLQSIPGLFPNNNPMNSSDPVSSRSILSLQNLIDKQESTSRVIYGAQIISHATRYNNDGQPIVDEYEFVAKDEMSLEDAFGMIVNGSEDSAITEHLDEFLINTGLVNENDI